MMIEEEKKLVIKIPAGLHKDFKRLAVDRGETMKDMMIRCIHRLLEENREQVVQK